MIRRARQSQTVRSIRTARGSSTLAIWVSLHSLLTYGLSWYMLQVATYPIAFLTQRFPTAKVCAVFIFIWSAVMMSTAACHTYAELMVNRFFLGVAEACIAPTFTVYITFWWTRREQPLRSSLWYGMTGVGTMFSPLISYGLGHINGSFGASKWKYMYLVAGSLTLLWSFVVLVVLPGKQPLALTRSF